MNNHATNQPHHPDMPERSTSGADKETGVSAPSRPDRQAGRNDTPFPGVPANIWLCYPATSDDATGHEPCGNSEHDREYGSDRKGDEDPPGPIWARKTVEAFSRPGDRVIIRAAGVYLGVAGETVALIAAAIATGRHPVALLPTVAIAARTRALLPPPNPTGLPTAASTVPPTALTLPNPPDRLGLGLPRRVPVGVGRRRPGLEAAPAGLVVVLSGPVAPGARPVRRRITPRLWASWARPLRPGGMLVVARPPELGARAARRVQPHAELITAAQHAGLVYVGHIVLVHAPTTHTGLAHPSSTRRPHAPFWPAHTDLLAFTQSKDYDPTGPTALPGAPSTPAPAPHTDNQHGSTPIAVPDTQPHTEPGSRLDNASDTARDSAGDIARDRAAHLPASAPTQPIPACPPPLHDVRGIASTVYRPGSGVLMLGHPARADLTPAPVARAEPSSGQRRQAHEVDEASSTPPLAPETPPDPVPNTAPTTGRNAVTRTAPTPPPPDPAAGTATRGARR